MRFNLGRAENIEMPVAERDDPLPAYWRRILSPDPAIHLPAAVQWYETERALSQLIAAVRRGEDVVIDHDGKPQVRLVLVEDADQAERERVIAKRRGRFHFFAAHCCSLTINTTMILMKPPFHCWT